MATWPWYGALITGEIYGAQECLDGKSYAHVLRWAQDVEARPAVQRGQRVNRIWGPEEERVPERHDASDFETQTWDKIGTDES